MDKENVLREIENRTYATEAELFDVLDGTPEELRAILMELQREREIGHDKHGRVALLRTLGRYKGRLDKKAGGFGFVIVGHDIPDIYVSEENQMGAFNGEEVVATLLTNHDPYARREGRIEEILSPLPVEIVGIFRTMDRECFVQGAGSIWVKIPRNATMGAMEEDRVVCEIVRRNTYGPPEGKITEILGAKGEPGIDILVYARRFGLEAAFPESCIDQAERLTRERITPQGRLDLRSDCIITIDGADAKDLDDAVSLMKLDNGHYKLGVHIADVSHYVQENTPLDKEALRRGTSVYLVDRVIPMLPKELSNGICSLNPHEDKYTLSCIMEFDESGHLVASELANSIISTTERMTYDDVNHILAGDPALCQKYAHIEDMLALMNELAKKLRHKRFDEGSIDFDIPEAKIELDENARPISVTVRERGDAEKLIEEFMLSANIAVAEQFYYMEMPFLYRVHEQPDATKIMELATFLQNLGIRLKGYNDIHPKALQNILNQVAGTPEANIVSTVTLRALQKARYDTVPIAHFGLAADQYCHFTSPIRRYPDLEVHRIVKLFLAGNMTDKEIGHLEYVLPGIADQSSERERNAIMAERAVTAMEMAEYMSDHLGEEVDGIISGVTRFGIFVELPNTIEGMIPLSTLDDYYELNEKQFCLVGEFTGRRITLGDNIRVVAVRTDPEQGRVEFAPANDDYGTLPRKKTAKKKEAKREASKKGTSKSKAASEARTNEPKVKSANQKYRPKNAAPLTAKTGTKPAAGKTGAKADHGKSKKRGSASTGQAKNQGKQKGKKKR